ncbi:MAG TPA: hypothetical protein VGM07_06240 [Stellaceae bacterium]|jgi:hypothetical protein
MIENEKPKRKRKVELRVVEAGPPPPPPSGGGVGGAGDGLGGLPGDRPVVQIVNGKRSQAIDAAETHLIARDLGLFRRDLMVVRVAPEDIDIGEGRTAKALRIHQVAAQHMRERFTRAVDLQRFDKRADAWLSCDCPVDFAEAYLDRSGLWRLRQLRAVITAPTLRPDGTIIERPGYDPATGIFYDARGVEFPRVPSAPTRADALAALDYLKSTLLPTFDFVDGPSRSVALSGIFTTLLRRTMSAAPLHGFSAPVAGSGKSKLVNLAAIIATGHVAAVLALGEKFDEGEKRLGAALISGDAVISIDNVDRPLGGEFLCQLLTEPLVAPRVLGKPLNIKVANVYSVFATSNNLKVFGDMIRRSLIGRLDPHCERPELREFTTPDPCLIALRERPRLVLAVLTVMRAFFLAGCPNDHPPLGSFAEWSRWVRDPLIWLGDADPMATIAQARAMDPRLSALGAVLQQWCQVIGETPISARELIERADAVGRIDPNTNAVGLLYPALREALLMVGTDRTGKLNSRKLGSWLGSVADRTVGELKVTSGGIHDGIALWKVCAG